jgi:ABC-type lipopolysaccharide export system ATPase subunit
MIIELLKERNIKVGTLAKELKVDRSVVYQSINGEGSRRIRVKIAKALNKSPSMLWIDSDKKTLMLDDYEYMHGDKS